MTQSDVFYRAVLDLTKQIEENRAIANFLSAIASAKQPDKIVVTHNVCRVEEDWVAAIERGLVFIGKAIGEDRQFIRSNGEVQPIEKVRHISKESVEHLSRHSDLITREPKEDIIPDKLYTVERLNDYAVYENRFLYLLLCKIRDFVEVRFDSIMRAYKLYRGELTVKKTVVTAQRRFTYECRIADEQDDVFAAAADHECAVYLDRIDKIRQSVAFYLRTPLMVEVARVDKIKKLTKTNVLRMDKNFREAVTLYEFLLSYEKEGYRIVSDTNVLDPVGGDVARALALPAALLAFLVYEHGLGIEDFLRGEYEKEEARREEARQFALAEEIKALKARAAETGEGLEQYMLLLEERNAALEKDRLLLEEARGEIESLSGAIDRLHGEIGELNGEIAELNESNEKLQEEKERAEEEHQQKLDEMRRERFEAEEKLKAEHAAALQRAEAARQEEIRRVRAEGEERAKAARAATEAKEKEKKDVERELDGAREEKESIRRECEMLSARLTAFRREYNLLGPADDFTTEEGFDALEHEFEVLGMLVREKWTDVRKILKKEFYGNLRTAMRGKKGERSEAYEKLRSESLARRESGKEVSAGGEEDREESGEEREEE